MSDRDDESRIGDHRFGGDDRNGSEQQNDIVDESIERPVESKRIVMPPKADVARTDQARRRSPSGPSMKPRLALPTVPLLRTPGAIKGQVAQAHPVAEPEFTEQTTQAEEQPEATARLSAPHPLSRLRADRRTGGVGSSLGFGGRRGTGRSNRVAGDRWLRPRAGFHLPSLRSLFGFAGLTATFGIVTALLVTLPSHPPSPSSTGSIYSIGWTKAVAAPVAKLDFGPYLTTLDQSLLMVGTVNSTDNGAVTSTTTVWATDDGSTWTQRSSGGAFTIGGRRFVAQGFSDDGQGGLVVVGNSIGSSPTDVIASAWHSTSGSTWTPMEVDSARGQEMVAGIASRPGMVVTAGNGVAWLSTDGRTWSPEMLPGANTSTGAYIPRAVGTWDGGFVIVGLWGGTGNTRSAAWYSENGRDWKQAKTSFDGFDVRGISGLGDKIVVVGADLGISAPGLAASWSSGDGNTWTKTTAPTDLSTVAMDGVARFGSSLVAVGGPTVIQAPGAQSPGPTLPGSTPQPSAAEALWISENGLDWLPITSTAAPLLHARLAALGNKVVVIGGSGTALTTVTGTLGMGPTRAPASASAPPANFALSVEPGTMPGTVDVTKNFTLGPLAASKDHFYFFATGPTGTTIYSSPNGSLWVPETDPDGLTSTAVPVQASGSNASGSPTAGSSAAASVAGKPPTASATPQPAASAGATQDVITGRPVVMQAISDGRGGIIATGKVTNASGDNGMIWHMTKTGVWQQVAFEDDTPTEFSSITNGVSGYVASSDKGGGAQIMYSSDGDIWQAGAISVGSGFALSVSTYRYGYLAVGTDATRQGATTAWSSPDGRTWTLRNDWHLPPNVTALFGIGNSLVATANTAVVASTASPGKSSTGSAGPSAKPTAKASPTPVVAPVQLTTWWSSVTGVVWQQSGLQTTSGGWAVINGEILVLDATATSNGTWVAWSSSDGKAWQRPAADAVTFAGSKTCTIASLGTSILVVSWDAPGTLKDYFGRFLSQ